MRDILIYITEGRESGVVRRNVKLCPIEGQYWPAKLRSSSLIVSVSPAAVTGCPGACGPSMSKSYPVEGHDSRNILCLVILICNCKHSVFG
jgi:hypothetical protein